MAYTLPAFRGGGVATAAGLERHRWLRDHGIRRVYGWMRAENTAMHKVRDRAGWRTVGRLTQFYWRIRRRYALLTVTISDPADPLAAWCGPDRLRVEGGIRIARRRGASSG
ncbi:MAG: GNAT family N-acetyltransferase [bacterium]